MTEIRIIYTRQTTHWPHIYQISNQNLFLVIAAYFWLTYPFSSIDWLDFWFTAVNFDIYTLMNIYLPSLKLLRKSVFGLSVVQGVRDRHTNRPTGWYLQSNMPPTFESWGMKGNTVFIHVSSPLLLASCAIIVNNSIDGIFWISYGSISMAKTLTIKQFDNLCASVYSRRLLYSVHVEGYTVEWRQMLYEV